MSRRVIEHAGEHHTVAFSDDEPVAVGRRLQAALRGLVQDEITGDPPRGLDLETTRVGMTGHTALGGRVGVLCVPDRVFPQDAAEWPVTVPVEITAPRYLPIVRDVDVAHTAGFPDDFTPHELGTIAMHRVAFLTEGRVTRVAAGEREPVVGATVSVQEVWPEHPDPTGPGNGDDPDLLSLRPPLAQTLAAAAGRVRSVALALAIDAQELTVGASAGDDRIMLSDRVGLVVGDQLAVSVGDPDREEILEIAEIEGAVLEERPAAVTLTRALTYPHAIRTPVRRVTIGAMGADNQISRETIPGDECVFLATMADLPAAYVAIDAGADPVHYHAVLPTAVVTDDDGRFRLPSLSRLARVRVHADDGAGDTDSVVMTPDYENGVQYVDLTL